MVASQIKLDQVTHSESHASTKGVFKDNLVLARFFVLDIEVDELSSDFVNETSLLEHLSQYDIIDIVKVQHYIFSINNLNSLFLCLLEVPIAQFEVRTVTNLQLFELLLIMKDIPLDIHNNLFLTEVSSIDNLWKF